MSDALPLTLPPLPEPTAYYRALVSNSSGGVLESWFSGKAVADDERAELPTGEGWDARIESAAVFSQARLEELPAPMQNRPLQQRGSAVRRFASCPLPCTPR